MLALLPAVLLGLVLGLRHALEPDHLAAVSTLLAVERRPFRGVMLGALWGLGHSAALLAVGVGLSLIDRRMPPRLGELFEFGVAVMLIVLGTRAIVGALCDGANGPAVRHRHGRAQHAHAGAVEHVHLGRFAFAGRPLVVGLIHGLAGSGSLTALAMTRLPSTSLRLLYIALFGVGSVVGMALLSGFMGWPLEWLRRSGRGVRGASILAGTFSSVLGIVWGWPFVEGWLR